MNVTDFFAAYETCVEDGIPSAAVREAETVYTALKAEHRADVTQDEVDRMTANMQYEPYDELKYSDLTAISGDTYTYDVQSPTHSAILRFRWYVGTVPQLQMSFERVENNMGYLFGAWLKAPEDGHPNGSIWLGVQANREIDLAIDPIEPGSEHDIEFGRLKVKGGDNAGKYYLYMKIDGVLISEYYVAADAVDADGNYTSNNQTLTLGNQILIAFWAGTGNELGDALNSDEEVGIEALDYQFTGMEADLPGYAEGIVEITPASSSGYYHLYWADASGILNDYEKITTLQAASKDTIVYQMPENMAIPDGATHLAAFSSNRKALESTELSAATLFEIPASKRFDSGDLEMNFASVSDVHMNYDTAANLWTEALNYFAELDLELVVVSGDCTNEGRQDEWDKYTNSVTASSYAADKIYVGRGNHDSQNNATYVANTSRVNIVTPQGDADSPWFYLLQEGDAGEKDNLFIFLAQELDSISTSHTEDNFSEVQLDWFEEVLEQFAGTDTNLFVIQHGFFRNWGPGDRYDGVYVQPMMINDTYTGNMRLQRLMMEYKEMIVMSGHSHIAYSEMVNYSDENGTACRMIHNSSVAQPRVYNAAGTSLIYGNGGSEGYIVEVYEDDIVYSGTNLLTEKKIPTACYIMSSYTEERDDATSISVTEMPDKTLYDVGEYFDAAGMEITATYSDGSEKLVQGWGLLDNTSISDGTEAVTVVYGDLCVEVPIKVGASVNMLAGEGTYEHPYLVSSPEDFIILTKCFKSITGISSNDNNTFGKGKYFLQTQDIDLTGYTAYAGTNASGSARYGFSGVYNGGGHTITVDVNKTGEISIFPYLNGVVMNVNFAGEITSTEAAQPIRTIGSNGSVINCTSSLDLTSKITNGLAYSNYGKVIRYFFGGTLNGTEEYVYARTNSSPTYADCYYDVDATEGNGTKVSDYVSVTALLNDKTVASVTQAVGIIDDYYDGFTVDTISSWEDMKVVPKRGDLDGNGIIDNNDLAILRRILIDEAEERTAADYDADGDIDVIDLIQMKKYVLSASA